MKVSERAKKADWMSGEISEKKHLPAPVYVLGALVLVAVICVLTMVFYRSLEQEIYIERTAYLKEISAQVVSTTNSISSSQWDLASIFADQLQLIGPDAGELSDFIAREEESFGQRGLSLLAFDEEGNYYNAAGSRVRWAGSVVSISDDAPEQQVEITTLPTTTSAIDEMMFVLKMDEPVRLGAGSPPLTHVAVVRDMVAFNEKFQAPSFEGQGESYIISSVGTKIYRGQVPSGVIGDVYNVLKPLETMAFQYDSSYEELRKTVAAGESCSLEFAAPEGTHYYVTCSPMESNGWSLLNIVPSDVVNARMQGFMAKALLGMAAIAITTVTAISTAVFLVLQFRSGQRLMRRQAEANAALQEAARIAEEANQAKTVFLSYMSHDIRTPINGIMGMADIATRNMDVRCKNRKRAMDLLGSVVLFFMPLPRFSHMLDK